MRNVKRGAFREKSAANCKVSEIPIVSETVNDGFPGREKGKTSEPDVSHYGRCDVSDEEILLTDFVSLNKRQIPQLS